MGKWLSQYFLFFQKSGPMRKLLSTFTEKLDDKQIILKLTNRDGLKECCLSHSDRSRMIFP